MVNILEATYLLLFFIVILTLLIIANHVFIFCPLLSEGTEFQSKRFFFFFSETWVYLLSLVRATCMVTLVKLNFLEHFKKFSMLSLPKKASQREQGFIQWQYIKCLLLIKFCVTQHLWNEKCHGKYESIKIFFYSLTGCSLLN